MGGAALLLCSSALFAAEDKAATKDDDQELAEVQVTGTRIQSPNVTAANPITSISGEEMRRLGMVNVSDALLQLVPQNISTYQPGLTGDIQNSGAAEIGLIGGAGTGARAVDRGSFFIGNTIANLRGLDPQFGTRTLTLVDGRNQVSTSSQANVVDLNIIPSNLLERMDVVTGGASATYGSGAMAGVVNLVLNHRLQGINLDMDYGVTQRGDGGSPHVALSGGTSMFEGKGHILLGGEWQKQSPIRNCAAARDWCARSLGMFTNSSSDTSDVTAPLQPYPPVPGFGDLNGDGINDLPAHFEVANVRYNQFSPEGVIYNNNTSTDPNTLPTYGYRFTADGTGVEQFPYGYRGATSASTTMNGDGPLVTTGTTLLPSSQRKTLFENFEYDFTPTTTAYLQGNYAATNATNRNPYTTSTACVRFNTQGVASLPGAAVVAGQRVQFGTYGETFNVNGAAAPQTPDAAWNNAAFRAFVGASLTVQSGSTKSSLDAAGNTPSSGGLTRRSAPWLIRPADVTNSASQDTGGAFGSTTTAPPSTYQFSSNVKEAHWRLTTTASGGIYWNLDYIIMAQPFNDPGTPQVLPTLGPNAYAFLGQLSADALYQVEAANNRSPGTGTQNNATNGLFGTTPCAGFTAIKKVWNPQIQQSTTQTSNTWGATAGVRGRFGADWKWEGYYQYGATDSNSTQYNAATNLSFDFAMDAVIDNRATVDGQPNPTYNQPVCRVTRDGVPILDTTGVPMSDPEGLAQLVAGCKPLNIFGTTSVAGFGMTAAQMAELQKEALAYAFKNSVSDGSTNLQTLSFNTNGTLWQGWAGPLTGAFGAQLTQNTVDNSGTQGPFYERADLSTWGDAFGGKTRTAEGFTEFNMPLVNGQDGINLWSVDGAARYTSYYDKGGAGTTGAHATQETLNWKFSTEFSPFDWVRFRLTRSRDLRAPDYRDLFLNQPSLPDQASGTNYWRDATDVSNENQTERWGLVRVGNPDLKPEKSDTLTLGLVLQPGGWAQGMNFSADYYTIVVKGGIYTPYNFVDPTGNQAGSCWYDSGNSSDPDSPNFGKKLYNPDLPECQAITFAQLKDADGNPIPGSRDLTDIVSVTATKPANGFPYQRRGIDLALSYNFPLNRAFEGVPGSLSLTARGTRALEASGEYQTANCTNFVTIEGTTQCTDSLRFIDLVGQIRSSTFIPGVSATPKWTGNFVTSYLYGNLTTSLSARYIGGAKFDNTWSAPGDPGYYVVAQTGQILLSNGSVDNNTVKPYFNFSLNASYNLKVAELKQFQVFGTINNLFDKDPPFTGGGISGASAGFNDTLGRAFRMGVRMKF
ncbi:MAG TPA: TonB-dependent receptor [Steroidobacteraceae bacterium]|nr:TonB-dependent receptor [Steroidobacteraceae bacterium]